ncbi:MAG: undecaprenyldiphospho-muramoylpentapeptide beta-N-acetylglucosaminyltransferase [Limnobacter sp.]|nr:undecaprenyldiphospho-muramoylpentapeptide beta-N-acetylglucosaminyltransferase [Limnobacter sp.]
MKQRTALIVAGGTGGHIVPGLAVARQLEATGWCVKWAGDPDAMEGRLVAQANIAFYPLRFSGFRGKGLVQQLLMPARLLRALGQSLNILRTQKPDVVLGMGGYVAFPIGIMAGLLNIPLVVHEQNSIAGLTNKVLARLARCKLVAFPGALPGGVWVGNPVNQALCGMLPPAVRFESREGSLRLLVVGGSLGASFLNELVPKAVALMPPQLRPLITHQSGSKHLEVLQVAYQHAQVQADTVGFIEDMGQALAQADVVLCRAGAMTVAEIAAVGCAAFFVPFPHAVDDHQTHNARFLVDAGAAWMRAQHELDAGCLASWLEGLTRGQCLAMAQKSHELAKPESTREVIKQLEQVVKHEAQG